MIQVGTLAPGSLGQEQRKGERGLNENKKVRYLKYCATMAACCVVEWAGEVDLGIPRRNYNSDIQPHRHTMQATDGRVAVWWHHAEENSM